MIAFRTFSTAYAKMSVVKFFLFMSIILGYQPMPTQQSSTVQNPTQRPCVKQEICHGGPSPEAFSELVSLVKEMKKKLDLMAAKQNAVCDGDCPSKRGKL